MDAGRGLPASGRKRWIEGRFVLRLRTLRQAEDNQEPRHLSTSRQTSVSSLRTYNIPSAIAG